MRLIMKTIIYFTDCQCYTETQAELRLKDKVSALIYPILIEHITKPILAGHIKGFAEQNGVLFLMIDNEMVSVTNNYSHPEFSNRKMLNGMSFLKLDSIYEYKRVTNTRQKLLY